MTDADRIFYSGVKGRSFRITRMNRPKNKGNTLPAHLVWVGANV